MTKISRNNSAPDEALVEWDELMHQYSWMELHEGMWRLASWQIQGISVEMGRQKCCLGRRLGVLLRK
jgi:hypothetical protein